DVLSDARLELGALSASATYDAENNPVGDYQVADGTLVLVSPAVAGLSGELTGALGEVSEPINDLVGADGALNGALNPLLGTLAGAIDPLLTIVGGGVENLGVTAALDVDLEAAVESVLAEPITSEDSAVTIDFSTGEVSIDLARLIADTQGGTYDGTLNGLDPNTEILEPGLIQAALDGAIGSIFDQIPALVVNAVTDALNAAELTIEITGDV